MSQATKAQALAQAVRAYLTSTDPQDERDIAFEAALLEQGVLAPTEAVEQISPLEEPGVIGLFVRLEGDIPLVLVA